MRCFGVVLQDLRGVELHAAAIAGVGRRAVLTHRKVLSISSRQRAVAGRKALGKEVSVLGADVLVHVAHGEEVSAAVHAGDLGQLDGLLEGVRQPLLVQGMRLVRRQDVVLQWIAIKEVTELDVVEGTFCYRLYYYISR